MVLLILAGISLNLVLGNNGIVTKANLAVVKQENATVAEAMQFKVNYYNMESIEDIKTALQNDGIMDANGIVDTYTLLEQKLKTGNGSDNKDVYVIEDRHLYYYDKNGEQIDLGNLWDLKTADEEDVSDLFELDEEGTLWLKGCKYYYGYDYWDSRVWSIENLVIPKEIDGKAVKKIRFVRERAQDYCWTSLKTVTIPEGVKIIGECAFSGCVNLTKVTMPNTLTEIRDGAFYGCSKLSEISIPDNVHWIYSNAFSECTGLTKITLPSNIWRIENFAFSDCTKLTSITIPDSVTSIGNYVFKDCTGLTSITIPSSVEVMGIYVFYGWTSEQTINCEASEKPDNWSDNWSEGCNAQIKWNAK